MVGPRPELLETFLKHGYLSPDDLDGLSERAERQGISLLEAALLSDDLHIDARGWILSRALDIPFLDPDPDAVPLSLADLVPELLAREHMVVPVSREGGAITLAVVDPFRHAVFARIAERVGMPVRLAICPRRTVSAVLRRFYPDTFGIPEDDVTGGAIGRDEVAECLSRGGATGLAEKILLHAAAEGMETLRVFPGGRQVDVRGRKGEADLRLLSCPLPFRNELVGAFRALAGLPAAPGPFSEATFHLESASGVRAFRVSFVQGLSGPEVVVKLLPDLRAVLSLDSLGLNADQNGITRKILAKGDGFYLLSSPGPEGVATTLFALLREATRPGMRVVTVEERYRFRNEGYIQFERRDVESRFAGKWAHLAESLEPDALMIEHVSDAAELADLIHLAQAGTVVLCGIRRFNFDRTLRTLLSLEVDPYILSHVVRLVMHQRLAKLLCLDCRRPVPAKPSLRMVGDRHKAELRSIVEDASFYVPTGCPNCGRTGYSGKMALVELLPFTPGVQALVSSEAWLEEKLARLIDDDFRSAVQSVQDLLRRGMVTYDDVLPFFR